MCKRLLNFCLYHITNVPLTKASQVAKPSLNEGGDCQGVDTRRHGSFRDLNLCMLLSCPRVPNPLGLALFR